MNQIIAIDKDLISKNIYSKKRSFVFKLQLILSIILIFIIIIIFFCFNYNNNVITEKQSSQLSSNYNVFRLYSNNVQKEDTPYIIGTIQIPKFNISYPVFSTLTDELLKVSPCKFYGSVYGSENLCIAGHNYDNDKFFSKIRYLKKDDKIIFSNNDNNVLNFLVSDNYEVESSNLSPIYESSDILVKELTLVTCNNQNNKRIIIKAHLNTITNS